MGIFEALRGWIPFQKAKNKTDMSKLFDGEIKVKASQKYWRDEHAKKPDKQMPRDDTSLQHGGEVGRRSRRGFDEEERKMQVARIETPTLHRLLMTF
jgi:hypothetical protein